MEPIQTTIEKVIKNWSEQKTQAGKSDILEKNLKSLLTKREQKHIKYCLVKNTQVVLGVDSTAWLYLLSFKKRQLSKSLSEVLKPKEGTIQIHLRLDTGRGYQR